MFCKPCFRCVLIHASNPVLQQLIFLADDSSALLKRGSLLCEMNRVPEGFEAFSRYAARVYGAAPSDEPTAPDHKHRHDREQREYLAAQGVEAGSFYIAGGAADRGRDARSLSRRHGRTGAREDVGLQV